MELENVRQVAHPLVAHHLTRLRDERTQSAEFRQLIRRLAALVAYEATKDLRIRPRDVRTPLTTAHGAELAERIGLVPILRAGLGMVDPILDLIPTAEVWHLGMYRDEATAQPVPYYSKLSTARPVDVALVLDPMLATGGSVTSAVAALREWGVRRVDVCSVIAAPEGVRHLHSAFPDTRLFVCGVDQRLDERKFILPGLGDAGDRTFNTPRDDGAT